MGRQPSPKQLVSFSPRRRFQNDEPIKRGSNGVELYDHEIDPEENYNRADDPRYASIRKELQKQLRKGWRNALPPM